MSRFKSFGLSVVAVAGLSILPHAAQAQGWSQQGNWGSQTQTDWQVQGGVRTENPGAAVVGGLLTGISRGLNAENPQRNAVASNVLGGLGGGMIMASQPTYWQQGSVQTTSQGWSNQRGGYQPAGGRPWNAGRPQPTFHPW